MYFMRRIARGENGVMFVDKIHGVDNLKMRYHMGLKYHIITPDKVVCNRRTAMLLLNR